MKSFPVIPSGSNPFEVGDPTLSAELAEPGVPPVKLAFNKSNVTTNVIGLLRFVAGMTVAFSRNWGYWVVKTNGSLSAEKASALNKVFGRTARAHGLSGGSEGDIGPCSEWHVDTQEALNALVAALLEEFGELSKGDPQTLSELTVMRLLADGYN